MTDVPEYAQVASALKDIEREVRRLESIQKKYQKLHKAVVDANAGTDAKTISPKQFNDLKRIYKVFLLLFFFLKKNHKKNSKKDLLDCCKKTGEASAQAKAALEPLQTWQELPDEQSDMEVGRKKVKLSTTGFKEIALPIWVGASSGHVPPPPLCGRVPYPSEARIVPGDLVAANINATKPKVWGSKMRSRFLLTF